MFQAGAHGSTGGLMSVIDGGDFGSGFASGAVSSLISSGIEAWGNQDVSIATKETPNLMIREIGPRNLLKKDLYNVVLIASGGLSGGVSSCIAGGSFWSGTRQGLLTSGLNHALHNTVGKNKDFNNTTEDNQSVSPDGVIRFKNLTSDQLKDFRIIPEHGTELETPSKNNKNYCGDGFYHKTPETTVNEYWFKVSNGSRVEISTNKSQQRYIFTKYINPMWKGIANIVGKPYHVDFRPIKDWHSAHTKNPFRGNINVNAYKPQ